MSQFIGLVRYEFRLSIRRPGLWIAYGILFVFYIVTWAIPDPGDAVEVITRGQLWQYAGRYILQFNIFLPLVGGILAADRMQRDFNLGVRELQNSTPLSRPAYILGKYLGVLFSVLLPVLLWVESFSIAMIAIGQAPLGLLFAMPGAFILMMVPAFALVTALSLAGPLIMPLRVYQIVFTGYWFWGNFLNPEAIPSISETYLEASGKHVYQGFLGGFPDSMNLPIQFNALDASLNLLVLALCIVATLFLINGYLQWKAKSA